MTGLSLEDIERSLRKGRFRPGQVEAGAETRAAAAA